MEKVIFKHYVHDNFFRENLIHFANQSGFIPGDPTVNQVLASYYEFYLAVDQQKEVCIIFLYISKAIDNVWPIRLLHKLEEKSVTKDQHHTNIYMSIFLII